MLFRMVPKLRCNDNPVIPSFRAVLFRMVPKLKRKLDALRVGFRAVLFRMVPKHIATIEYRP